MGFSIIGLSLVLCVSGAFGFTGASRNAFIRISSANRDSALRAQRRHGPELNDDVIKALLHPSDCPCCVTHEYGISSRAARIEIPLKALFASAVFASPGLADDAEAPQAEAEAPAADPPATEAQQPDPVEEEKKPEPAAEESKPAEEEAPAPVPAPEPSSKPKTFDEALKYYFPKALPTSIVATKVQTALSQRKFTRGNTLFGTCVCPDEINNKPTKSLPAALQNAMTDLNGVFHLGGLAGLPYMGASGMKAFLSHTPSNGKVFIMYGPHVGVTDAGIVGSVERLGKTSATLDCDTTLNALKVVQSLKTKAAPESADMTSAQKAAAKKAKVGSPDKREEYIVTKLRSALDSKEASKLSKDDLPAFATYQMFALVKEQIIKQLQACLKDDATGGNVAWDGNIDEIVLLGGIIVNRGQLSGSIEPREDYFEPLVFDSYSNPGNFGALAEAKDLYQPAFGAKPIPFYAS